MGSRSMNAAPNQSALRCGVLSANKLRSALTMLGIIIGVAAVIALLSVGQGVQVLVTDQLQSIGTNLLFVIPGNLSQQQTAFGAQTRRSLTLRRRRGDCATRSTCPIWRRWRRRVMTSAQRQLRQEGLPHLRLGRHPALSRGCVTSRSRWGPSSAEGDMDSQARVAVLGSTLGRAACSAPASTRSAKRSRSTMYPFKVDRRAAVEGRRRRDGRRQPGRPGAGPAVHRPRAPVSQLPQPAWRRPPLGDLRLRWCREERMDAAMDEITDCCATAA